jgi:AraC-like DNA-binding protein
MILIPFKDYNELNKKMILPIINSQWFIYILFSGISIKTNFNTQKSDSINNKWLLVLLIAVLIIWIFHTFIAFNYFVSGSIVFSILFYSFFLFFLFKKKITSKVFQKTNQRKTITTTEKTDNLISKLNTIMINEKLFTNPDLKSSEIAVKLEISTHELSKLINENIGKSFTDFINEYRIKEAKELIKTNSKYTIEAIGTQSGFNSKSAFYKAFKKFTNVTPAKYKSQL